MMIRPLLNTCLLVASLVMITPKESWLLTRCDPSALLPAKRPPVIYFDAPPSRARTFWR
jgi:hypothetical protein